MKASSANAFAAAIAGFAAPALAQEAAPPGGAYKKVSELVTLPDFLPGLGQLYVDPATLPAGPFLAYDHDGKLVSTDLHAAGRGPQSRQALRRPRRAAAATSTTSTSISTPAIRAWRSRTRMSCCGTCRRPTRRASRE